MFGLGNSAFLAGLAAAGLPVLIHFLTKARPRRIAFPAYKLLVDAGQGRQALDRLRTALVLLFRTLAVLALILAFCRVYWTDSRQAATPDDVRRVVLVVDSSLSLRASRDGIPLFTHARAQAADLLRSLDNGSYAAVVFAGAKPRSVLPALSQNLSVLHEGLASYEATQEDCDAESALALAASLLEGPGAIYVFSDFQRTNWASADFSRYPDCSFFLRPLVEQSVDNAGLTAVRKSPEVPVENETFEISCTVFNASPVRQSRSVRLELEGFSQSSELDMQPFSSAVATFSLSLPKEGIFPGHALIGGDALPEDDVRHFAVRVRSALNALVLSDSARNDLRSGAFLVDTALAPGGGNSAGLNVTRRLSQDVDQNVLEKTDVFALVSPVQLPGHSADIIARRIKDGAQLLCFLDGGDGAASARSAQALLDALAGASDGEIRPPFVLGEMSVASSGKESGLGAVKTQSGPLKVFHSADQGDLGTLKFSRHFITASQSDRAEEILIQHADGSCALALSPAGRGSALFINLPVTPDGGNFAGSPLFPVLLHECLRELRQEGADRQEVAPGEDWAVTVEQSDETDENASAVLRTPSGKILEPLTVTRDRNWRLELPAVAIPGAYPVYLGDTLSGYGIVNTSPRETDTRQIYLDDLVDSEDTSQAKVTVLGTEGEVRSAGQARPFWPELLAMGALFLAIEMLILSLWRKNRGGV